MNKWFYLRLTGALLINLGRRILHETVDWWAGLRKTIFYTMHSPFSHFGNVRRHEHPPTQSSCKNLEIQRMFFYHPIDRRRAVQLVAKGGDGCYLVRPSSCPSSLTLTLWNSGKAYNIPIRIRPDRLFALGSRKPRELSFHSILEMIKYYEKNPLIIADRGSCPVTKEVKLTRSPATQDCR